MTGRLFGFTWNSIRFKLVFGLLVITLPTVAFLIYNNNYAIRVVHKQVAESNRNLITMYMEQIDSNLDNVDKYMTNLIVNDPDLQDMEYQASEQARILAKVRLDNRMKTDIANFQSIDSMFVYSVPNQELLEEFQGSESMQEREGIRSYIQKLTDNLRSEKASLNRTWYSEKINGEYYLFRVLQTSDSYVGAWLNIERLSVPLSLLNLGKDGISLFSTEEGEPMIHAGEVKEHNINLSRNMEGYYFSGDKISYLVLGQRSTKGDFRLVALIPNKQMLENLPYLKRIASMIPIAAVILVPVYLLLLRKMVLRPLNRIIVAMKRIGEGNLNTRIDPFPTSDEFLLVNETFNRMMQQVQELRINVYEEQLSKQKAELQHLQLQINPHFYMNALNIIYNLALVRNYELIQEMALNLVRYFRYMFRSNLTFVTVKDELEHVRNYIRIQELRFPDRLSFEIAAPEYLLAARIPPLVIQTFVENSIKHAIDSDVKVRISVRIKLEESESEPRLLISVQDTGKGFSKEVLEEIRAGNRIIDEQGEHIGIWNVQRRLGLLYPEKAYLLASNAVPSGALIEMLIPL
ncbi:MULTISPECIES: histidine kinase [unclassified Paenibacillus]|uniref:sensor histidine kinase n=1 Tax=unclassified Paenibacillus TaxID=185978 RepID=UPI0010433405|nr:MULTISPECIES: histidine kinase [unclassified Paenibacillus]NIK69944.1 two-component system sensor histidine kinase YesM [Paenibacillus sp. BK720]TCM97778.1 two-component system sensor histidine kinase YesM [Paenibacillus sp. BK033]